MIGLIVLIICFSTSVAGILSFAFGLEHGLVLRALCLITAFFAIYSAVISGKSHVSKKMIYAFGISLIVVFFIGLSFFITEFIYGYEHEVIVGTKLSFFSKVFAAPFIALLWNDKNFLPSIKKWILPLTTVCTLVSLYVVKLSFGLNYQKLEIRYQLLSYTAAFLIGLLLFYLKDLIMEKNRKSFFLFFSIAISLLLANLYVVFSGGGKGAFFLVCVLFMLFFVQIKYIRLLTLYILLLCFLFCMVFFNYDFLVSLSGFNRIIDLFLSNNLNIVTSGRDSIYDLAWSTIRDHYFLGCGAGASVYETGYYAHNLFLDILIDWGFIGLAASLCAIVIIIKKWWKLRTDENISFLFMLFVMSFTMLLFSSSFYCDFNVWFSSIAIIGYDKKIAKCA